MSGMEIIGLISAIISIIDGSIKVYEALKQTPSLPKFMTEAASRLPLIRETLEIAKDGVDEYSGAVKAHKALMAVLTSCMAKMTKMDKILRDALPAEGATKTKRYLKAVRSMPKADDIERLMDEIIRDLQVLTTNRAVQAATRSQINQVITEMEKWRGLEAGSGIILRNIGSGSQYAHTGFGDQTQVSGKSVIISGASSGPFYIGM